MNDFDFQPASENERPLIHQWLAQDYIHEWIHGQGLQNTLNGLEKFLNHKTMDITQHWIGFDGDKPFVYLLTSHLTGNEEYLKYRQTNGPWITLDIFIGDSDYVGKGLAVKVIHDFLCSHYQDIAEVFIDPEQTNHRAIHVYEKAGFKKVGEFIAPWHPVLHDIMRLDLHSLHCS